MLIFFEILPPDGRQNDGLYYCENALAVAADILPQVVIDSRSLLHSLIEHLAPLAAIFIQFQHAQQVAGLDDDFEGVAEIVGISTNLLSLLQGDGRCSGGIGHGNYHSFNKARDRYL